MSVPDGLNGVARDVIQNLRMTLDYLVYQIAWLDSGVWEARPRLSGRTRQGVWR